MKYEWRKQEKALYGVKQTPVVAEVPKQQFIMIRGQGNPNEADFSERISALYALAYAIKMQYKKDMKDRSDAEVTDFTVYPLEGLWENGDESAFDKNKLTYTLMIKQPDFITQREFTKALETVRKKKPNDLYDEIGFEEVKDGKAIQILHVGSYDDEPKSFALMDQLANELSLTRTADFHREIYLSNRNRTAENKQKTILRYSVR
ncbi:GyrI-like domain-containing protein [Streptococcus devriesei]|uniref:GyrI-like domain-containing protein n=1 Tax=Streptococcus devriesei TaxID=231233 RepID=UPI00040886C9|nr:GyrI-like domain-containing protein [Streptococcus devriesei]